MNTKILFYLLPFLLFACNEGDANNEAISKESPMDDSKESVRDILVDRKENESNEEEEKVDQRYEDQELQESHEEIVKKYGTQWDFCKCVVKNDSVQKAFEKEGLSDKAFDLLFERSEHIDKKCKELLIYDNSTPEKREKYQIRVDNCLKAAK